MEKTALWEEIAELQSRGVQFQRPFYSAEQPVEELEMELERFYLRELKRLEPEYEKYKGHYCYLSLSYKQVRTLERMRGDYEMVTTLLGMMDDRAEAIRTMVRLFASATRQAAKDVQTP